MAYNLHQPFIIKCIRIISLMVLVSTIYVSGFSQTVQTAYVCVDDATTTLISTARATRSSAICSSGTKVRAKIISGGNLVTAVNPKRLGSVDVWSSITDGGHLVQLDINWASNSTGVLKVLVQFQSIHAHGLFQRCKWDAWTDLCIFEIHKEDLLPGGKLSGPKTTAKIYNDGAVTNFTFSYVRDPYYPSVFGITKLRYWNDRNPNKIELPINGTIPLATTGDGSFTVFSELWVQNQGRCGHWATGPSQVVTVTPVCPLQDNSSAEIRLSTTPTGSTFDPDPIDKSYSVTLEQPYYLQLTGISDFTGNYTWQSDGGSGDITITGNKLVVHKGIGSYRIEARPKYSICDSKFLTVVNGGGNNYFVDEKCTVTLPQFLEEKFDVQDGDLVLSHFATYVKSERSIVVMPGISLQLGAELIIEENDVVVGDDDSDKNINFTEAALYDEYGRLLGQSRNYFDNRGLPLQTQYMNLTANVVLANATLYDALNRPAISTLSAPVRTGGAETCATDKAGTGLTFGYVTNFVKSVTAGHPAYDFTQFDNTNDANNAHETAPVAVDQSTEGTLGWYYGPNNGNSSNVKMNEPQVATTQYPYSRTLFKHDGTGEVKGVTKPGDAFKAGSPYIAVSDQLPVATNDPFLVDYLNMRQNELHLNMLLPLEGQFVQTISLDETGKKTVSYSDKSKKTIIALYFGTQSSPLTKSYQFYDDAGRLVASISPNGLNQYNGSNFSDIDKSFYKYNAKGQLQELQEKDGGRTQYLYRKDGKIRFSQNEEQRSVTVGDAERYSYTNYDKSGRPVESGEYSVGTNGINFSSITKELLENTDADGGLSEAPDQGSKKEQTISFYDEPDTRENNSSEPQLPSDRVQRFVQGAVSWTKKDDVIKTWYSYDEQDRTEWQVQYIKNLGYKTIDYIYGPTGQVQTVIYQKGVVDKNHPTHSEQFCHYYEYDLDGRLHKVYTTRELLTYDIDGRLQLNDINGNVTYAADDAGTIPSTSPLELQATYSYYLHGPLKRIELAGNLQGIDYLYTADGALKSINHADPTKDPGQDGIGNTTFTADVFGMTLDYYTNDYVGANEQVENITMPTAYADQYSGLIKAMRWHSPVKSDKQFAYAYSYDDRNQFTNADWGVVTINPTDLTGPHQLVVDPLRPYQEGVPDANGKTGYDANGNINFLQRNSNRLHSVNGFDYDLAYHYESNSNKLLNITNGDNTSLFRSYQYNGLGQMIMETKDDKTSYITYDVSGKVTGVYADVDHTQPITTYLYDDRGFRLSKTSYGTDFSPTLVTWYVRNAGGDVLSTYEDNLDDDGVLATEIPIYGSGRIGLYKPLFGNSFYELSDHLGNTRAVIGKVITDETLATMEGERSDTESEQFVNVDGVPSSFNHTPSVIEVDNQKIPLTSPGNVNRINNGVVGANPIGVGRWLPVEPGDVIEAEVYVKYADFQSSSYNPVTGALSQLENSFINHSIIDGVSVFSSAVTPLSVIIPASTDVDDEEPLAFLNYLLYDKHGNLVRHDNIQVSSDAEITADKPITFEHERLSFNLTIDQGSFLYVFVSNLTNENLDVYFDDLRIKQTMSDIVAGGDYYPYGLAIDDRQIDRQPFRYGYQGKNAEKDDETGWNHFELREYDPVIGRWTSTDPKGQFSSPYIGMANNPQNGVDPDGGWLFGWFGSTYKQRRAAQMEAWRMRHVGAEVENSSKEEIRTFWDGEEYQTGVATFQRTRYYTYFNSDGSVAKTDESTLTRYNDGIEFDVGGQLLATDFFLTAFKVGLGMVSAGKYIASGGLEFEAYKEAMGGTRTLGFIETTNKVGEIVYQRISTEFHHGIITQRFAAKWDLPNWLVNNRINVWRLNTVQHSLIDMHRFKFLRFGFKSDVGWFGKYNWFTRY